jgi:hypothetical protein
MSLIYEMYKGRLNTISLVTLSTCILVLYGICIPNIPYSIHRLALCAGFAAIIAGSYV